MITGRRTQTLFFYQSAKVRRAKRTRATQQRTLLRQSSKLKGKNYVVYFRYFQREERKCFLKHLQDLFHAHSTLVHSHLPRFFFSSRVGLLARERLITLISILDFNADNSSHSSQADQGRMRGKTTQDQCAVKYTLKNNNLCEPFVKPFLLLV